ncbi:glycosyltransferase family 4 protein [Rhodanobacter soli]|uniref:glycosyltransferase family 4 protein n=1 Tax=Rhodanobacter soli TaxID=590609 RepID=UPI0031D0DFBE
METYSVELAAALESHFEVTRLVLPGRKSGRTPSLFGYGVFLLKAMLYGLIYSRKFTHLVLGDLVLFPVALCCRLANPGQRRTVIVYGLDLVYGQRKGLLPRVYAVYFTLFRACRRLFLDIVAISGYTAQLAIEVGLAPVRVVTPALPQSQLTATVTATTPLPKAFARAHKRVLQFGRLVPRKGALWFAQNVVPLLPDDVEFFVVGSAHGYCQLDELTRCARTHYLGPMPTNDLATLIRSADAVVMPNVSSPDGTRDVEGFGLVAIETSSIGGLLIASRLQGITDALQDGVTGLLVEAGNTSAWRDAVCCLLDETPAQLTARRAIAAVRTRDHYSRKRMGDAFASLLLKKALSSK